MYKYAFKQAQVVQDMLTIKGESKYRQRSASFRDRFMDSVMHYMIFAPIRDIPVYLKQTIECFLTELSPNDSIIQPFWSAIERGNVYDFAMRFARRRMLSIVKHRTMRRLTRLRAS